MAKKQDLLNDHDLAGPNGMMIPRDAFSIPNLKDPAYGQMLAQFDVRLQLALQPPTVEASQMHDKLRRNVPYVFVGPITGVDNGQGKAFSRDFMHRYNDMERSQTGRTLNVDRIMVTTEEDFKLLQKSKDGTKGGLISANAEWAGPGKYMGRAIIASKELDPNVGAVLKFYEVDPYAYLPAIKAAPKDPKSQAAAAESTGMDPAWFGMPRDMASQVLAEPKFSGQFDVRTIGMRNGIPQPPTGQPLQPQVQPGQPVQPGQQPAPGTFRF